MSDDTPPQTPPQRSGGMAASTMMAALALVTSVAALGVAVIEARISDNQQRALVWPYLELGTGFSGDGFYFTAVNKGAGPARLQGVSVSLNGTPVRNALELATVANEGEPPFGYDVIRASSATQRVLRPGEELTLFAVPWRAETRAVFDSGKPLNLEATACFCSIFDECWEVKANDRSPPQRAACGVPEVAYQ